MLRDPVFLLLAIALVVVVAVGYRSRDRRWLAAAAALVIVLGVYLLWPYVLSLFGIETPARQMQRRLADMAAAVQRKDLDGIFQHVSDEFQLGPLEKQGLRSHARRHIDSGELTSIEVWDFDDPRIHPREKGKKPTGSIRFKMKPKGNDIPGNALFEVDAEFVEDADGQWRLRGFKLYRWRSKEEFSVPYLPIR